MNDAAVVFILVFVAVGMAGIAIAFGYMSHVVSLRRFRQLAQRFGGVLDDPGIFGTPTVRFDHHGVPVRIQQTLSGREDHGKFTEFRIPWSDSSVRLAIRPEGTFAVVGKFLGVEDMEIGSREFDDRYLISGNNKAAIRSFLTPGVQQSINALYYFRGVEHVFLSVQGGHLEVKKLGSLGEFVALEEFVTLCLDLLSQAQLASMKGIEFVASQEKQAAAEAVCQVCGDKIGPSDIVYCRSCQTPHHQDCWNYFGACSTFGCGQTVFKRPKLKRRSR
jgi:hypothetical protein